MRNLYLITALFAVLTFTTCGDPEIADPIDLSADYAYFPLELDRPLFYDQDSIVLFNTVGGVVYDTSRSQVRETLVERFTEADGSEWYRGERWQRPNENSPWTFVQTYTVSRTEGAAFRREDNLQFTKLVFPIRENRTWDGNAAFDVRREIVVGGEFLDVYNGWDYRYQNVDTSFAVTDVVYPNALFIRQARVEDNLIDFRRAHEIYVPGVGLVERFIDARHTQCRVCCNNGQDTGLCFDLPWDEKAEKGFILRQTIR